MPINYKNYPFDWKTRIVPAVLERAGNCCEECHLVNHSFVWAIKLWVKDDGKYKLRSIWFRNEEDAKRECTFYDIRKIKVILTISHTDHDENNHDVQLDRLKALCQVCHLRYDAKEKYRRVSEKWATPKPRLF